MAKYGLIGKSLIHSQSKKLHALIEKYEYDLIEVNDESELKAILDDTSYDGFNVTIPYKDKVIKYLDQISDLAKEINGVNVVKRMPDGKLYGYNTDIDGFNHMVGEFIVGCRNAKLPAHFDYSTGKHVNLSMTFCIKILEG